MWQNTRMKRLCSVCFLVCFLGFGASARDEEAIPPGGRPLIGEGMVSPQRLEVRVGPNGKYGSKILTPDGGPNGEASVRVIVTTRPPQTWDAACSVDVETPVQKGDAILVGFWARGKGADGVTGGVGEFVFERKGGDHRKSIQYLVETPADGSWQQFWIRLKSAESYAPKGCMLGFQLGYLEAEFEVAGMQAWNYGGKVALETLPHTQLTYVGRDRDAAWRKEAAARIEQHRKGDLTVRVVDAEGKPVAGIPVRAKLDRIAFDFGTCVSSPKLLGEGADAEIYREKVKSLFNLTVLENGLKWRIWEISGEEGRERTRKALDWLEANDLPVRGHVMVWPGYRHLPKRIKELGGNKEELRKAIDAHIRMIGKTAGTQVREWDVLNEVFANRDLTNILGDEEMVHWFKLAREVAPHARLYYNDYAGLVRGGFPTGHKQHFEETLRYLKDNGAPLGGVAIQGHFGSLLTPPHRIKSELDRWAQLDLPIMVTEYDVTVPGARLRADFTRDFLTMCFSHPQVHGVVTWGFWAKSHWKPESAMFDADWKVTPMGEEWIRLTTQEWTTDETKKTDANGEATIWGFVGAYSVSAGGETQAVELKKGGARLELRRK